MRSGKPVAVFAVLLVVSFATMNAMPSDTLLAALLQEAVLALVALVAVGLAVPDALKRCTQTVQQRSIVRFTAITLLLVGLVGGAITLLAWLFAGGGTMACFASTALPSTADLMENLLLLLGICLLTGLYEESFMRVLGIEAFERALDTKRAILASAALFALLHVGAPDVSVGQLVLLQAALKFGQALLFGVILGALYARTRRLWPCTHPCRLLMYCTWRKRAPSIRDARNICIKRWATPRRLRCRPLGFRYRLENRKEIA